MSNTVKTFDLDESEVEPITFKLGKEEFEALGEVPGIVLLEFLANSKGGSDETANAILEYLNNSFDEENKAKFDALVRDPKRRVKIEKLSDVVAYLIEERASRPTEAS